MAQSVKDISKVSEIKPIRLNDIPRNLKKYNEYLTEIAEVRGRLSAFTKETEKKQGYNLKAFKLCSSLEKLNPAKRADFLMTFDAMRDRLGWDNQPDLIEEAKEAEETETDNVVAHPSSRQNGPDDESDEDFAEVDEGADSPPEVMEAQQN